MWYLIMEFQIDDELSVTGQVGECTEELCKVLIELLQDSQKFFFAVSKAQPQLITNLLRMKRNLESVFVLFNQFLFEEQVWISLRKTGRVFRTLVKFVSEVLANLNSENLFAAARNAGWLWPWQRILNLTLCRIYRYGWSVF